MGALAYLDTLSRGSAARTAVLRGLRTLMPGLHHSTKHGWRVRTEFPIRSGGFTYYVNSQEAFGISRWLLDAGDYGADERALLQSLLRPGDVFLDIGANIGVFLPVASSIVGPSGRVIAIEPSPDHLRLLRQTVRANQLPGVTVIAAAAGAEVGTITLFSSKENTADHHTYARNGDAKGLTVPVTTIDALKLPRVDVIMMDTQGSEGAVFSGMRETLARNPQVTLLMEFWPRALRVAGTDPVEMLSVLLRDAWHISAHCLRQPNSAQGTTHQVAADPISVASLTEQLEPDDLWVNMVVARKAPAATGTHQAVTL